MWPGRMSVPEIDVQTLATEREAGRRVFDVREPDEYDAVRIPDVELVPLATVPDDGTARARGHLVVVAVDVSSLEKRPVPPEMIERLAPYTVA